MTIELLTPVLAGITIGAVLIWAFIGKSRTDALRNDPKAPKSSLAKKSK